MRRVGLAAVLACLALAPLIARPVLQEETKKSEDAASQKANEKPVEKPAEKPVEKPAAKQAAITVHVFLKAGDKDVPGGSSIELKPDSGNCDDLGDLESDVHSGKATFADVPVCKVKFLIYVTGYNAQGVSVDLSKCKEPITLKIDSQSPPKVGCS